MISACGADVTMLPVVPAVKSALTALLQVSVCWHVAQNACISGRGGGGCGGGAEQC